MRETRLDDLICIVDLDDFDKTEQKKSVKPATQKSYDRTLALFDQFLKLHPKATSPPDLRTYKGFLKVIASKGQGRIEPTPTVGSMDNFRRLFETAWWRERIYEVPKGVTTNIKEHFTLYLQRIDDEAMLVVYYELSEDEKPRIQSECKNIYNEIRRLYNVELKSQRQQQPLRLQRVKEDRPLFNAHERTFFRYSRQVMPERDLLADLLSMKVELRSTEGRAALRALESIWRQKGHVAYRKSFMPIEDRCICGVKIEKFISASKMATPIPLSSAATNVTIRDLLRRAMLEL
ncbi:hypothetical protein ACJ73_01438 [Blastomyces percursus]|uniref:Uncharacterized protein n=1 Tax=Blastomyces percursus TaxID=1658174 RepID=A0A1J9RF12_9EURO|nr:hypothetical protein ACJ73_01438 [Blastomyces percursus]